MNMKKLLKRVSIFALSISILGGTNVFAQDFSARQNIVQSITQTAEQKEMNQDQKEIADYLNKKARNIQLNREQTYQIKTSSENIYQVTVSMEQSNKLLTRGQDKYVVEEGKSYDFKYNQKKLSGRTGEFNVKVNYTVDKIDDGGFVGKITGNSATVNNISPIQGTSLDSSDMWFSTESGFMIEAKGYITFKYSYAGSPTVNIYPTVSIVGAGNKDNANKVMVTYGYTM